MILEMRPVSLVEVKELVEKNDENKDMISYLKKFSKMKKDKAEELSNEIRDLKNLKVKEEHIVKVVDFLPSDAEDLNKIFNDISLDEKETNEILEIVKKY